MQELWMLFFFFSLLNLNKFFPQDNLAELFFSEAQVNFSSVKFDLQVYICYGTFYKNIYRLFANNHCPKRSIKDLRKGRGTALDSLTMLNRKQRLKYEHCRLSFHI